MLVNKGVMGESVRKRRSLWDTEEKFSRHELNTKNAWVGKGNYPSLDGGSYQEQLSSKTENSSKRHSGWNHSPQNSLLQTSQSISKDVEQLPETEHKRENIYRENMSPTFDGWRQQRNIQFPEYGFSQSCRHPGRGRSRSPGRAKGRSRSRSWSRDRGWRSRSRSRSRDKRNLIGRSRSRSSPPNYNGDPYGWDDRQIGSRISSKVCRDFANGKCWRGGECRFFHPDNFKNRDGYSSEYNLAERWGSRNENEDASRYANSEAIEVHFRGKIPPDAYNLEHEHPRNNRGMITCKDFVKGKCRWGASCRFSHSGASGHNYDCGIWNASSDYDQEHEPSKTGPLCKYFVAGKCYSENCRFSHDGPTPSIVEMRPFDDIGGRRSDEKNDSWVGLKWNDTEMDSSFMRASRRGENVAKLDNSGAVHTDRNDHIGDHSIADTNKLWNKSVWDDTARASTFEKNSEWDENALRMNPTITVPVDQTNRWIHSLENERAIWQNTASCEERDATPNVIAANTSDSILENLTNNQENNIISQASESQNLNGSSVHGERQDTMKETSGIMLSTKVMQPCLSSNPYIESYPFEDSGKTIISNVSNDLNNSRQCIHPVSLPEQSFNEISERARSQGYEYSSFLDGAAQGEARLHAIPSNGHDIRSNESTESCQKEAATRLEVLELSAPQNLSGAMFSVPTIQLHGSLASLTKKFEHEPSVVPSDSNSEVLPTYNAVHTRPNPVINAPDLCHAHSDGFQWGTPGNCVMATANASYLDKQETSVSLKQSNELSALNSENENIDKFDDSNVEFTKDQCLKQQEAVAKSEVNGNNRVVAKECEDGQENKNSHNANGHGKDEEVNGNKDDKVIRLFKNALIEFVKEVLKPTWKEGRMSREVHKTIVKKVVDKVTGSIQGDHFPKTQDKIEQYLSYSKAKISKLAQAYVERCLKANS